MGIHIKGEYKKFVALLEKLSSRYNIGQIFEDFLFMSAIAIKNSCVFDKNEEDWYFSIIKKYDRQELEIFPKLLAELISLFSKQYEFKDILGEIYTAINLKSKMNGQFFTPTQIAETISNVIINRKINDDELITVFDPTCGSGVMLLEAAERVKNKKMDYTKKLEVYGQDIDIRCFCMTYIQLSLAGISGIVVLGNTLLGEKRKIYFTPQYVINHLEKKDKKAGEDEKMQS